MNFNEIIGPHPALFLSPRTGQVKTGHCLMSHPDLDQTTWGIVIIFINFRLDGHKSGIIARFGLN